MICELPLTYFRRLPERKLLSGGVVPVGVIVAEISLMSQMPPIYVMNR